MKIEVSTTCSLTVESMVNARIILKDPERFLEEVVKSKSLTTFKKNFGGLFTTTNIYIDEK